MSIIIISYFRLKLKQNVLEQAFPDAGNRWYRQQAARAVNQAIGRIVRHKSDYGLILLIDERFNSREQIWQLSKWIRPTVNNGQQK